MWERCSPLFAVVAALLAGCAATPPPGVSGNGVVQSIQESQRTGTGAQVGGTVGGALVGGALGSLIGGGTGQTTPRRSGMSTSASTTASTAR